MSSGKVRVDVSHQTAGVKELLDGYAGPVTLEAAMGLLSEPLGIVSDQSGYDGVCRWLVTGHCGRSTGCSVRERYSPYHVRRIYLGTWSRRSVG